MSAQISYTLTLCHEMFATVTQTFRADARADKRPLRLDVGRRQVVQALVVAASTASIIARLRELGEVARVMAPDFSWPFFNVLESRIRARHKPARDKRNVKLSDELLGLGLLLIEKATR